ncbi:MAG TPA: ABC transporter ATP-binding protein [Actinomycetes bacterium]
MSRWSRSTEPADDMPPPLEALWRMFRLAYRVEPRLLAVSFAMTVVTALPGALIGLWLALLVDGVGEEDRGKVLAAALGLAASSVLTWYTLVLFDRVQRRFRDRVSIAMEAHVASLLATVATIAHHERREHVDRLEVLRRATFGLDHLFMSVFSTLAWVLRLTFVMVLLATQVHPALLVLLVFVVPIVVSATVRPGVERAVEERVAPHRRLARNMFQTGTTPEPGKEVRVTGNADRLVATRRREWRAWYEPMARQRWVTSWWHGLAWAVFGIGYVGAIVLTAALLDGTPGQVVLVLVVGNQLSQSVAAAVGELGFLRSIWLDLSRRLMWLEDYAAAADPPGDGSPPERLTRGVRFDHVSFRYPDSERLVLDDVSLDLPAGAVVAIVGENGAGKSTLVKLLARMYAPSSGRIEVDGVDLASMSMTEWRSRLAGAFQDFYRFELTALDAIGLGELPRLGDRDAVRTAVGRAGAADLVDRLERGIDTQLGATWHEGVEVSFGQWQKVALARGFMRDEPLVLVLDEPTAALDAETEHALFERFAEASRDRSSTGRVTLLVSHRFSTVRMADVIVVLDGARVTEVGSHDELIARGGQYAELYAIQVAAFQH